MVNSIMALTIIVLTASVLIMMWSKVSAVETKALEVEEAEKKNSERLNRVVNTYNSNFETYNHYTAELDEKMDKIITDIQRMDDIELKATHARSMAANVARCYLIGDAENTEVENNG